MKIAFTFVAVLIAYTGCASAKKWIPSTAQIAELEASLKLEALGPLKGSQMHPLSEYQRVYTGTTVKGHKVILAELLLATPPRRQPGVRVVASERQFPVIFDGGCSVIRLTYSIEERVIVSAKCNGEA